MIAIGNGEKCPFCDLIMEDFKIGGKESTKHMMDSHSEEFTKALFDTQQKDRKN